MLFLIRSPELEGICGWGSSFWQRMFSGKCVKFPICCKTTRDHLKYSSDVTGIVKEFNGSDYSIRASPKTVPFIIPKILKRKPIQQWNDEDRIWLST